MSRRGFTLIEVVLGALVIAVAIAAILGAYVGQVTLNEHARNLSLAIQDANRVIEQIRQQNSPCGGGGLNVVPLQFATWDGWLNAVPTDAPPGGGPKSIQPTANERIIFSQLPGDPRQISVAVCWRHRGRIIGECDANLQWVDGTAPFAPNGIAESPAMLTTLVTCR